MIFWVGEAEDIRAGEQHEQVQEPVQQCQPQPGRHPAHLHLPPHLRAVHRLAQGPHLPLHQHGVGGAQHHGLLCLHQPRCKGPHEEKVEGSQFKGGPQGQVKMMKTV